MRGFLLVILFLFLNYVSLAQEKQLENNLSYTYAYISVEGKTLSKKLIVTVDLGDTPAQIAAGKKYSETLTNRKSYAAILNYMVEEKEIIEAPII